MNVEIIPIILEKETVSDDFYIIDELYYKDEDKVQKGDIILVFETSKSVIEVESPSSGYIHYNVKEGQKIAAGAVCAAVSNSPHIPNDYFESTSKEDNNSVKNSLTVDEARNIRISKAAKELLKKHNLDISIFKGKTILKTEDIYLYLKHSTGDTKAVEDEERRAKNNIIIIGGGGHAKMCIDIIRQMKTFHLTGIVDSYLDRGTTTLDAPVVGGYEDLEKLFNEGIKYAGIGIGALQKPEIRQEIYHKLKSIGYLLPNLIHPAAVLEPSVTLGEGNQLMAGAIVGSSVRIGSNCIINSGSIISHDSILYNNVHITPGAILAGMVKVGSNTIIGMGATIYMKVKIGNNVIIPNGLNIVKDIPESTIKKN